MISVSFERNCVSLIGRDRWAFCRPELIGEGGGWWWMDMSADKMWIWLCRVKLGPADGEAVLYLISSSSAMWFAVGIFSKKPAGIVCDCQHPLIRVKETLLSLEFVQPLIFLYGFMFIWWQIVTLKKQKENWPFLEEHSHIDPFPQYDYTLTSGFSLFLYFQFLWSLLLLLQISLLKVLAMLWKEENFQKTPMHNIGL